MAEPQPTDAPPTGPLSDAEREARIEQLLLAGLDHYFGGQFDQAINIWTRVTFLERGNGRARAYIERARSAVAERQRESEELVHAGVAAYNAGDLAAARDLLTRAVDHGGPSDTALLFLQRLSRLDTSVPGTRTSAPFRRSPERNVADAQRAGRSGWLVTVLASAGVSIAILLGALPIMSWLAELPVAIPTVTEPTVERLPIVRDSEALLARARANHAAGRLRDVLTTLDRIDLADPRRAEADRLRADVQRELLETTAGAGR
jgi:tetratricopeptide (TPR) repeat protein